VASRATARLQLEAAVAQRRAAEAALATVSDGYDSGSALLVEVIAAQASATDARSREAQTLWSGRLAGATLAYLAGILSE
jgi:outer membrane protein TolC